MAEKTVYIIDLSDKVTGKLQGVRGEAKKTDSTFADLKKSIGGMGGLITGALSTAAIVGFGSEVIQTTAKFQGLTNSIKFASDSAQQGEVSMQWLSNLSKTYGLEILGLTEGFKTFQGAMMKTRFTSNEVRTMFAQVSTGVTAMGLSTEDAKGTFLALGQIMGKGKVQAEELRGQIGERIPGAFAIAARAMNMSTSELDKFMSDGKLLAEDFLPKFAAEMEKTFGAGAIGNADSLTASLNRTSNAWTELTLAIGNSDSNGLMGKAMGVWSSFLEGIADKFRTVKDLVKIDTGDHLGKILGKKETRYKEQLEYMQDTGSNKSQIESYFTQNRRDESLVAQNKISSLKAQILGEKERVIDKVGESHRNEITDKYLYETNSKFQKLTQALEITEQTEKASQGMLDKVISSAYMPKNVLAEKGSKTKKQGAGGMTLNESRNGATNITFNIDTFQKNEFSKDGSNINNSMIKSFLDQMADGLATVLNDSQIAARR